MNIAVERGASSAPLPRPRQRRSRRRRTGAEPSRPMAVIFGCAGTVLTAEEQALFRAANPLGFILFRRNCESPDQVRALVDSLRETVGRDDTPVMIDQEGGRVQRLKPPHWPVLPAPGRLGTLAVADRAAGERAVALAARILAALLTDLGLTVNAAPMLDLRFPGTDAVIGDRSFGSDPDLVAALGAVACRTYLDHGIIPVIKHMPGHGRATVDSHKALPRVTADEAALTTTDFAPFRALRTMPWGMTAHIVYEALDPDHPATQSAVIVDRVIRRTIGFDGLLVSDDLSMNALAGTLGSRAGLALAAGCDVALHCNGVMAEMDQVAEAARPLTEAAMGRLEKGKAMLGSPTPADMDALCAELDALVVATGA